MARVEPASAVPKGRSIARKALKNALLALFVPALPAAQAPDSTLVAKALGIHEHVIAPDTHADIDPTDFTNACDCTLRVDTHVKLPRIEAGCFGAAFFIVHGADGDA